MYINASVHVLILTVQHSILVTMQIYLEKSLHNTGAIKDHEILVHKIINLEKYLNNKKIRVKQNKYELKVFTRSLES